MEISGAFGQCNTLFRLSLLIRQEKSKQNENFDIFGKCHNINQENEVATGNTMTMRISKTRVAESIKLLALILYRYR